MEFQNADVGTTSRQPAGNLAGLSDDACGESGGANATELESPEREARSRGDRWWGWYWLAAPNPRLDVAGRHGSVASSPETSASGEHLPPAASIHWGVLVEPS